MSDAFRSASDASSQGAQQSGSQAMHGALRSIAYVSICAALGVIAYTSYWAMQDRATMQNSIDHLTEMRGLVQTVQKHLSPDYRDQNSNLLADAPTDPAALISPDTLVLAHYTDADADTQLVDWEAFKAALAQATGKDVLLQEYQNSADDVAAVQGGKIQLVALHAADAPYIVNNAGFIPVAVLGTESGAHGNRLDITVGAKTKIEKLSDIRGRKLTCTAPDSMTGYRAAIIVLEQEAGLRPDVDYSINFSLGQKRSVLGLVSGEFTVAALSDDKIESMLKNGSLQESDYRIIYRSEVIPRLTIGYVYNLESGLAAKVTSAALAFANEAGAPDEATGGPLHFVPINYLRDFEFVRTVDDSFDPRFSKAVKTKHAPIRDGQPTGE